MRLLTLLLALVLVAPAAAQDKVGTTAATFLGIGTGGRAMAMGNAQTATAQGVTALFYNPAAVADLTTHAAEFSTTTWLVDSRISFAGVAINAGGMGTVGLHLYSLNYGDFSVRTIDMPEGTGERFTPNSLAFGLSYSRALTDRFAVGGTVKYVRETIWNSSAQGAAVDLGLRYTMPFRGLQIGMAMTNFGTDMRMGGRDLRQPIDVDPNVEGNNPRNAGSLDTDSWAMPLAFRVGIAMDVVQLGDQRLTVDLDALAPADNAQSANVGAEYGFRDLFFVRGGYRQAFATDGDDQGWTAGAGLNYGFGPRLGVSADYAVRQQAPFDLVQTFSLGLTF